MNLFPARKSGTKMFRLRRDLGAWPLPVSERRECRRLSEDVQDRLHATLRRAKVGYFRIYDLCSTYATRLSAGGVADEWVTQLLRQGDAKVFKKYSQMKLQMKREALTKLNRQANEGGKGSGTAPRLRSAVRHSSAGSLPIEI